MEQNLAKSISSFDKAYTEYKKDQITYSFQFETITPDQTLDIINQLNTRRNFGHDSILTQPSKSISV